MYTVTLCRDIYEAICTTRSRCMRGINECFCLLETARIRVGLEEKWLLNRHDNFFDKVRQIGPDVYDLGGCAAQCTELHFEPATTMKIFSLSVILAPPSGACTVLSTASDLSTFSFYQKGSVGEFMSFFSKTVAERTAQGQRQSIQENNYTAHVYNRGGAEQLAGKCSSCLACAIIEARFSCYNHRPRIPSPPRLFALDEAIGRFHCQSSPNIVQRPCLHLVPRH